MLLYAICLILVLQLVPTSGTEVTDATSPDQDSGTYLVTTTTYVGQRADTTATPNTSVNVSNQEAYSTDFDQRSFLERLLMDMDPTVRPVSGQNDGPVEVKVDFHVLSISAMSEANMEYQLDIYFRQTWTDRRLAYNLSDLGPGSRMGYFKLGKDPRNLIWVPDLFFPFEKQASFHVITVPNIMVQIYPSGEVMYSTRLTLVIACKMQLSSFPMDSQTCPFDIESYSYQTSEMILLWKDNPVTLEDFFELPRFSLKLPIKTTVCTKEYKTGSFPCLQAKFEMSRFFGDYLLQTYIPSGLIVILSWVAFWINKEAIPARVSLSIVTVMTLVSHIAGSKTSIPSVTYLKAVDVWMMMAMVFVFAAVIEYAFVNSLDRKAMKAKKAGQPASKVAGAEDGQDEPKYADHAKRVDKVSRIVFPLAFVLFNAVYWPYYTRSIPSE